MKISFIVLTKNEEKNLQKCLFSIKQIADEIIILDEHSTDKTEEIARQFNSITIQNKNSDNFSAAHNLGMKKAKNEWIFFIDADEELVGNVEGVKSVEDIVAFRIKRKDFMLGKEINHGENGYWNDIRLVKKGSGKWIGKVHEVFEPNDKVKIGMLACCHLKHYPHQTIREFLKEVNTYSDIRAQELFEQKITSSVWQIALYPLGKFVTDYFFLLGFLDGTAGFIIAAMMSFYSFLVRAKLYILCRGNTNKISQPQH